MVKGILHSAISTKDMAKSLDFYCRILGGKRVLQVEEPKGSPWIECVQFENGTAVELFYPSEKFPVGTELGKSHFCFVVEDIKGVEKVLMENEVEITSNAKVVRDANWQIWCKDPNGYPVEFIELVPECPQLNYNGECKVLS